MAQWHSLPYWYAFLHKIPFIIELLNVFNVSGPGKFNLGNKDGSQHVIHHAFDGLAFVHRFEIKGADSTVQYNSRMTAEGAEASTLKNPSHQIYYGHLPEKQNEPTMDAATPGASQQGTPNVTGIIQDPSSRNVNVTVTPNYPLPEQFGKDETDPMILVSKTDSNRLQCVHSVTLGESFNTTTIFLS